MDTELFLERNLTGRWLAGLAASAAIWLFAYVQLPAFADGIVGLLGLSRGTRLGEALREEIAALIEGELGDPRIGLATVTEVQMAPDGRAAHVLVAVVGDEHEAERALQGLTAHLLQRA